MTDIVMKLKAAACPPNTGCMSMTVCVCDAMEDAADEIERLREAHEKTSATLSSYITIAAEQLCDIERLHSAIADAMDALAQGGGGVRAFDTLARAMQDKLEDKHG